ncbi:hypothetical protein EMIT0P171_150070 [Pseudomonas sp. IT-P171]
MYCYKNKVLPCVQLLTTPSIHIPKS